MPASRTSAVRPRPALSPREAQALREALALRQALAAGQTLTPAQVAGPPHRDRRRRRTAAAGSRTAPAAQRRQPVRRQTAPGRPARSAAPSRKPTAPRQGRPPSRDAAAPARAGRPGCGVVAMSTLLLPAVAVLVLPGVRRRRIGRWPARRHRPGADRPDLAARAGRPLPAARAGGRPAADRAAAGARRRAGRPRAGRRRAGRSSARPPPTSTAPRRPSASRCSGLSVHDAGCDLRRPLPAGPGRARRPRPRGRRGPRRADRRRPGRRHATAVAAAEAAVAAAGDARPPTSWPTVRDEVDGPQPRGDRAAGRARRDPRRRCAAGPQQPRAWRAGRPTSASSPPPASSRRRRPPLADSADLPAGLSPALDAAGRPVPGVAWAVIGNSPVTVLPAETVVAVSTALSQLGKPFVGGTSGPDTYDCGGFTSAAWLLAGYAVPSTPESQWATGAPVALTDLQIGDLVFSPGGQDVGIYLGDGDVVGASAGTYQVGVRSVAAGSSATRVTLPAPATPNAGAAVRRRHRRLRCAAAGARRGQPGVGRLRPTARSRARRCAPWAWPGTRCAATPRRPTPRMSAAFAVRPSGRRCASPTRTGPTPARCRRSPRKPAPGRGARARPTTAGRWRSTCAVASTSPARRSGRWMTANAGRFGFVQPDWARPGAREARAVALGVRLHLLTDPSGTGSLRSRGGRRARATAA